MDIQREGGRVKSAADQYGQAGGGAGGPGPGGCGPGRGPEAQVFRSAVDLVSFGVTVVDKKGGLVTDLARDDFEVLEDGAGQAVTLFARGDAEASAPPLHLGLLFDTSGSMEENIGFSRSAAIKFLNAVPDAEDITLVDFDTEVRVARYGQHDFARLVERIRRRKPDGIHGDARRAGRVPGRRASEDGRRVLVLYTDGSDTSSAMTLRRGARPAARVRRHDVRGRVPRALSQSRQMDQRMRLRALAEMTGGLAFFPTVVKDLDPTYEKVAAEIRAQFTIGYLSTNATTDGTWRKVEIKVKRPGVKVRTRQGYFAPYRKRP